MRNIEKWIYMEMIRCCFSNSKKRKKFQRVFKNWTQEERDSFLKGLGIRVAKPRTIKVYLRGKSSLRLLIKTDEYEVGFKERVNFMHGEREDYISSQIISRREPLI